MGWVRFTNTSNIFGQLSVAYTPTGTFRMEAYVALVDWSPGDTEAVMSSTVADTTFFRIATGTGVPTLSLIGAAGTSTYTASTNVGA